MALRMLPLNKETTVQWMRKVKIITTKIYQSVLLQSTKSKSFSLRHLICELLQFPVYFLHKWLSIFSKQSPINNFPNCFRIMLPLQVINWHKYTVKTGIALGDGSSIPNLQRRVFQSHANKKNATWRWQWALPVIAIFYCWHELFLECTQ